MPRNRGQSWPTFIRNHLHQTWACDFLTIVTLRFQILYCFVIVDLARREIVHIGVTSSPSAQYAGQLSQHSSRKARLVIRLSAQMLRAFAHQIPAQFGPKVALPCPPRGQSWLPFPEHSVVDRHCCGEQAAQVMFGNLYGPLEVATGGTSILLNQASIDRGGPSPKYNSFQRIRQSLVQGQASFQAKLPDANTWPPESWSGVLSPDGTTLAFPISQPAGSLPTELIDVSKATVSVSALGPSSSCPLAWNPSGELLLVLTQTGAFSTLTMDGRIDLIAGSQTTPSFPAPDSPAPATTATARYFWTASGPQVLLQGDTGATVYNIATQTTTQLVEANRVAPPTASIGVVVATDQVFAWALQCFGIGETSCNGELRRLSNATGRIDVVARAGSALPFAVSPDGTKIAFADTTNIYLKSIQA